MALLNEDCEPCFTCIKTQDCNEIRQQFNKARSNIDFLTKFKEVPGDMLYRALMDVLCVSENVLDVACSVKTINTQQQAQINDLLNRVTYIEEHAGGKQQQADWNETNTNSVSFIKNKSDIPSIVAKNVEQDDRIEALENAPVECCDAPNIIDVTLCSISSGDNSFSVALTGASRSMFEGNTLDVAISYTKYTDTTPTPGAYIGEELVWTNEEELQSNQYTVYEAHGYTIINAIISPEYEIGTGVWAEPCVMGIRLFNPETEEYLIDFGSKASILGYGCAV